MERQTRVAERVEQVRLRPGLGSIAVDRSVGRFGRGFASGGRPFRRVRLVRRVAPSDGRRDDVVCPGSLEPVPREAGASTLGAVFLRLGGSLAIVLGLVLRAPSLEGREEDARRPRRARETPSGVAA